MAEANDNFPDVSDASLFEHDTWRPHFARLRAEDPVHWHPDSPFGPYWSVSTFNEIMEVDSRNDVFSSEPTIVIGDPPDDFVIENFISMDEPRHTAQRNAFMPTVAARNLMNMEPVIRARLQPILDGLPDGETFDWVDKVAIELTTQMLATLFDFPFEERRKLTRWSDMSTDGETVGGSLFTDEERQAGLMECAETFLKLFNERSANPDSDAMDLVTMMAKNPATRDMPSRPMEFLGNVMLLIVGGNDTTRNTISGGVLALNEFPEQYDKLRADLSLIPNMVSEFIRWQTSVIHMRRTALSDTELGGKKIRQGDKVIMWYISGNRDESVIPDADKLIIDRPDARRHVSFGFGVHRCMGNRLAEMQLRVLWEEVMKRFRFVEVMGPPERLKSNFIRGITRMPVRVHRW